MWTKFFWFRTGSNNWVLWTQYWTFCCHTGEKFLASGRIIMLEFVTVRSSEAISWQRIVPYLIVLLQLKGGSHVYRTELKRISELWVRCCRFSPLSFYSFTGTTYPSDKAADSYWQYARSVPSRLAAVLSYSGLHNFTQCFGWDFTFHRNPNFCGR
jgi:hypothetical protein